MRKIPSARYTHKNNVTWSSSTLKLTV